MKTIIQVFNSRIQKYGSFEELMILVANRLNECGYKSVFAFPGLQTEVVRFKLEECGARIRILSGRWNSYRFVRKLYGLIKKEKPYVVDFHFCYFEYFILLALLVKLLRNSTKLVYHYHGEIRPIETLKFVNKHFSKLRFIAASVDKVVTVSEANRRFLKALNVNKTVMIYNGIKIENFYKRDGNRLRQEYGISERNLIVTYIGSIIPRKRVDVLLRAAAQIIHKIHNVTFIIVGGGSEEGPCKRLAGQLGIADKVIFTGLLKEYPYHILAESDLFMSASSSESFGIVFAEAMAFNVPVVATRVGGIPEVVRDGETGLLVPPGDADALASAAIKLLESPSIRDEMGKAGRMRVERMFNLDDKVERLLREVYNIHG